MYFSISKKSLFILLILLFFSIGLRGYFASKLPLSGDEVGVGVLQSTGHALSYHVPSTNTPVSELKKFIDYSPDKGIGDILSSLRHGGMHPPFYYILLNTVIKYLNNDAMTLRSLSLVFSVISIALIFFLGRTIHGEQLGLLSAFFLTISPYCLQYSIMVRPYPLLMVLALSSSLLIYQLVNNDKFHFYDLGCHVYILISTIGLYTMYHYIFVIFFQAVFATLSLPKNIKRLVLTGLIYLSIGVLFVPWLPFMKDQMDIIDSGTFYFHWQNNPIMIFVEMVRYNFFRFLLNARPFKLIILLLVLLVLFIGCKHLLLNKKSRFFLIALISYVAAHLFGDWVMQAGTLSFHKFQFFITPVFLFILAFGLVNLPDRYFIKSGLVVFLSVLLICSSISILQEKKNFDGPEIITLYNAKISESLKSDQSSALLIMNTSARRYVLPVVHFFNQPIDIVVANYGDASKLAGNIKHIDQYDHVFVGNLSVDYEPHPQFSLMDMELIENFLGQKQFIYANLLVDNPDGALIQFNKKRANL
ncbi:MAG: hypothetical protein C4548_02160 [Desulfobacteraceae bacterium]|nr:MAG: hypothetical protein C4548_02160 [Desulfobacteraceae bacterium]